MQCCSMRQRTGCALPSSPEVPIFGVGPCDSPLENDDVGRSAALRGDGGAPDRRWAGPLPRHHELRIMEPSIWDRVRAPRSLKGSLIGYVPFLLIVGISYVVTDSQSSSHSLRSQWPSSSGAWLPEVSTRSHRSSGSPPDGPGLARESSRPRRSVVVAIKFAALVGRCPDRSSSSPVDGRRVSRHRCGAGAGFRWKVAAGQVANDRR